MSLISGKLNDYLNVNDSGTRALRNFVAATIYNGDSFMVDKLVAYQLFWKFYDNKHWARDNDNFMSFNWTKAVINKINNFTLGSNSFEFNVEDLYGEEIPEELETALEALVDTVWKQNNKKKLAAEIFQMGGVCGDSYVFVSPLGSRISITLLDTRYTYPIFNNGDYGDILGYTVITPLGENAKKYINKVTEYRVGKVITYYKKDTDEDSKKYEKTDIPTGLTFVPIVHIENAINAGGFGGYSDAADIIKLNKAYNELAQDVKDIVDYYTTPITVITGSHVANLKRGVGEIWSGLPSDANVQMLGLGENLSANMDFLKLVKGSIHDLSGVPEEVLSKVQHISNTSAVALKMMYHSLTMAADNKITTYSEGITKINDMIVYFKMALDRDNPQVIAVAKASKVAIDTEFLARYKVVPKYIYQLPTDRLAILQEGQIEKDLGVGSSRTIMERLGIKNIPKVLGEASKEKEETVKLGISQNKLVEP